MALKGHELAIFESKLTAVGFGFFVPFFSVTSGIDFDLAALGSATATPARCALRPPPDEGPPLGEAPVVPQPAA